MTHAAPAPVRLPVARLGRIAVLAATLLTGLLPTGTAGAAGPAARPASDAATVATAAGSVLAPERVTTAPSPSTIKLTRVISGLSKPVLITSAHDSSGRLFIVEKTGRIKVYRNGAVRSKPLLNLSGSVSSRTEQGLLGLAFHPNFDANRRFYVNFTNTSGDTVIREYRTQVSRPNRVASGSGRTILKLNQPYANHNGGHLAFGPDGYLYVGTGDGGGVGDPGDRAQRLDSLLGKMLRIDVNGSTSTRNYLIPSSNPYVGTTGRDEIWQRGLRNPWRYSFDRATGDLWIGDVGQYTNEEVDRADQTGSGPGKGINWGWRVLEGFDCFLPSSGCSTSGMTPPLLDYSHASGRCSVTGGYVYRGVAIPDLVGWYVFADYCSGEIWAVSSTASSPASKVLLADTGILISSFGENQAGELYVVGLGGSVHRVDPA